MKASKSQLPAWFPDHCIKTRSQLANHKIKLVLRDANAPQPTQPWGVKSESDQSGDYEMEAIVLEALTHTIVDPSSTLPSDKSTLANLKFEHKSILLRLPGKPPVPAQATGAPAPNTKDNKPSTGGAEEHKAQTGVWDGGQDFLTAVVETLASQFEADLLTMNLDDIRDLAEHMVRARMGNGEWPEDRSFLDMILQPGRSNMDSLADMNGAPTTEKSVAARKRGAFWRSKMTDAFDADPMAASAEAAAIGDANPFRDAIKAAAVKGAQGTASARTLLIHLPDIFRFVEERLWQDILNRLGETLDQHLAPYQNVLVIGTTQAPEATPCKHEACTKCQPEDLEVSSRMSRNPDEESFSIFPIKSPAQKKLFLRDVERQAEERNIRALQRCLRMLPSNDRHALAQPYAVWDLPEGSYALKMLRDAIIEKPEAMARAIGVNGSLDKIAEVLARPYRYKIAKAKWVQDNSVHAFGWELSLPPHARDVVRQIQTEEKFEYEAQLLDTIIDPNEIDETWNDIEVDAKIQQRVWHMISLSSGETTSTAYGVLKKNLIKGTLVYGAPGTGKTHLARVLAKESGILMLNLSSADIESKWHGDTEKYIKAIFNLGRMISPCLIFIDEADALFRRRNSDDKRHERKYLNQFLSEIDGLSRSNKAPFLMLATNTPGEIDHALLRRVPGRFYIGFPSAKSREGIFRILLRDETLHEDVDLASLALQAKQYTGSDIRVACVQAAMVCEEELVSSGRAAQGHRRVLQMRHLQEALKSSSPTGPSLDLLELAMFAKELDPAALPIIEREEEERRTERKQSRLSSTPSDETATRTSLEGEDSGDVVLDKLMETGLTLSRPAAVLHGD